MDPATLSQLVSTLGFPIVVCGVLFYILKLFLTKLLSNLEKIRARNEEIKISFFLISLFKEA